jgi:hypothetical protein
MGLAEKGKLQANLSRMCVTQGCACLQRANCLSKKEASLRRENSTPTQVECVEHKAVLSSPRRRV